MAFCTNCGAKIEDDMQFCPKCGASVQEGPQPPKGTAAPKLTSREVAAAAAVAAEKGAAAAAIAAEKGAAAANLAAEKFSPVLKRHYKVIAAAALAVVILFTLLTRCAGGGGKQSRELDTFLGYWTMEAQVYSDATNYIHRPRNIGITENAIQLEEYSTSSMSDAECRDGALYFSAQWYQSVPIYGQEIGEQDFDLRLTYDKSSDQLTLEVEAPAGSYLFGGMEIKYSAGWYPLGEYSRAD